MSVLSLLSDLMDAQVTQMKLRPNEEKKLILSQNILVEKFGTGGEEIVYASIQLK